MARMRKLTNAYRILADKSEERRPFWSRRHTCENNGMDG